VFAALPDPLSRPHQEVAEIGSISRYYYSCPQGLGSSIVASCPDYLGLLPEYPPLVLKLVQLYPWERIEAFGSRGGA
jgi:hypothetical protein